MATTYPVSRRLFALAAQIETTYGAEVTATFATNGQAVRLIERPEISRGWLAENLRESWFTGGLGQLAATNPSGEFHELDVQIPLHGYGAAYATAAPAWPNIHPFLLASGFSASVVNTTGSESWTYDPTDLPGTGLSIRTRKDGKEYRTVGGVVTSWSITAAAGEYAVFNAKVFGYAAATSITETDIGNVVIPSTAPILFKNATCTISSYVPVIRSFELSVDNTYAARGDGLATKGHAGYRITRRQIEFKPVIEHDDITDFDPEAFWEAATQLTFDLTLDSGSDYNICSFDADDMRVIGYSDSDGDGLTLVEPIYRIFTPASGSEFQIQFAK